MMKKMMAMMMVVMILMTVTTTVGAYTSTNNWNSSHWVSSLMNEWDAYEVRGLDTTVQRGHILVAMYKSLQTKNNRLGMMQYNYNNNFMDLNYGNVFVSNNRLDLYEVQNGMGLLQAMGVLKGIVVNGQLTAQLEKELSRVEFTALVVRFKKLIGDIPYNYNAYSNNFDDIDQNHWAYYDVNTAKEYNIVDGVGYRSFATDMAVTTAQTFKIMTTFVSISYDLQKYDIQVGTEYARIMGYHTKDSASETNNKRITSFSQTSSNVNVNVGEQIDVVANIRPYDAFNKNILWEATDGSGSIRVVYVNEGTVRIEGLRAGTAYLRGTTTDGSNLILNYSVRVNDTNLSRDIKVSEINVNPTSITLTVGASTTINPMVYPSNATNNELIWELTGDCVTLSGNRITAMTDRVGVAYLVLKTTDGSYVEKVITIRVTASEPYANNVNVTEQPEQATTPMVTETPSITPQVTTKPVIEETVIPVSTPTPIIEMPVIPESTPIPVIESPSVTADKTPPVVKVSIDNYGGGEYSILVEVTEFGCDFKLTAADIQGLPANAIIQDVIEVDGRTYQIIIQTDGNPSAGEIEIRAGIAVDKEGNASKAVTTRYSF
ncbi:MAG: hypothetical protein PHR25_01425 [Clostridia bacterium]|nr:hypothetical protein [Clostridia bacterium]MDD4375427.1 hypothetical protein [Clostridia bacterium]